MAWMSAGVAHAQPSPQGPAMAGVHAEDALRREEERLRLQPRLPDGPSLLAPQPAQATAPLPQESPCFIIHRIRLTGAGADDFKWLQTHFPRYTGACMGPRALAQLAQALDEALIHRGYATSRVSFPAQHLASGELSIALHVGRVADVRMVQPAVAGAAQQPDTGWGTWRNAVPVGLGDVLNIRDLEQGVEQMKRLPSQAVRTRIEPGPDPDTSVIVIERPPASWRERLRGSVSIDNSGSASLGRTQAWGSLVLDNPAGLNDLVSLTLGSNLERVQGNRHSQSAGFSYSVPWGYSTLSLGTSHSRFAQHVQGTTVRFLSSGQSDSTELRLHHTLWRNSSARLGVHGAVASRRARSHLDDVELLVQRRRTTAAEVGAGYRQVFERASLEIDLALREGVGWNSAQPDFPGAGPFNPTLRPAITSYALQWSQALATDGVLGFTHYTLSLRGQRTRDATLATDQMAIGGRSSVRGFSGDTVLMAENGVVLRNEWVAPVHLPALPGEVPASLVFGLDWGRVWGPSDSVLVGRELAGLSLGLRGRACGLAFDAALGVPLHRPDGFRARGPALFVSLSRSF